ncbi:hypothetical protein E4U53_005657 [Claviceps sorghi]|nr:hypothetical protein E4U53_005657 [Claviceps sorghi]
MPLLSPEDLSLLQQSATAAKQSAYCPYSNFRVGAALLLPESLITGANVENAAYPAGTCAERVALAKAVASDDAATRHLVRQRGIRALGVATDVTPPASPCGMCRQFMREFCSLDMPIYMFDKHGNHVVRTLGELLPMSFGPDDLKG